MKRDIVEKPLKDIIIEILGKDGLSIHSLSEKLKEMNINMHRLVLTGYLRALRDVGILRERDIKPAKVFSVQQPKKKSIYEIIGEKARDINEENAADICLYSFYRIFNRPIFLRELNRAGVGAPENGRKVVGKERQEALKILINAGFDVPRNNSAFVPTKRYDEEFAMILTDLIVNNYNVKNLVNKNIQQMRIDTDTM